MEKDSVGLFDENWMYIGTKPDFKGFYTPPRNSIPTDSNYYKNHKYCGHWEQIDQIWTWKNDKTRIGSFF